MIEKLRTARDEFTKGIQLDIERQTLQQFLAEWLTTTAQPRLRPRTFHGYRDIVARRIVPHLGPLRLKKVTPQHVQRCLNDLSTTGLSPATVRGARAVLRAALNDAVSWNLIDRNPAVPVRPPRATKRDLTILTPADAKKLLVVAEHDSLGPLFCVAIAVGVRLGEALGLRWSDVDLESATLRVAQALQRFDGKLNFVEPKSKTSRRAVILPAFAVDTLRRHQVAQKRQRLVAGGAWVDSGLVFTSTIGTPLDDNNVRNRFKALLKKAGLAPMRLHDLRHTCASLLLAQGVHPRLVMETLGHSQISLTMDTYSHVIPALNKEVAEKMNAALA